MSLRLVFQIFTRIIYIFLWFKIGQPYFGNYLNPALIITLIIISKWLTIGTLFFIILFSREAVLCIIRENMLYLTALRLIVI